MNITISNLVVAYDIRILGKLWTGGLDDEVDPMTIDTEGMTFVQDDNFELVVSKTKKKKFRQKESGSENCRL